MLISGLLGNETAEKVLLYLENYDSAYPREVALAFGVAVSPVQNQFERLEREGLVVSRLMGKTRVYTWNPRCFYLSELHLILKKALKMLPESMQEKYFRARRRPRRKGKPLP